jgi:carbonic anhydrase
VEQLAMAASAATGTPEPLIPDLKFLDISVNIHPLLSTYFFYEGSLSTPPCTSKVTWLVLKRVVKVKEEHLSMIQKVLPDGGSSNARSLQPLNGRDLSVAGTVQL